MIKSDDEKELFDLILRRGELLLRLPRYLVSRLLLRLGLRAALRENGLCARPSSPSLWLSSGSEHNSEGCYNTYSSTREIKPIAYLFEKYYLRVVA